MRPENINTVCHRWIKEEINDESICIDATAGRGNDTLFLAQNAKKVYAFDIQEEAIASAREKTEGLDNITFLLDSHVAMDRYVSEKADCIVFNFGYLPKGDKGITTLSDTSRQAIEKAILLLNPGKCLFLVFYIGHSEGRKEHEDFLEYIREYDQITIERSYTYEGRKDAPILYQIRRIS